MTKVKYAAILLAAGSADRFGINKNKVLLPLMNNDKPVFAYSLELFINDENCKEIYLIVQAEDKLNFQTFIDKAYREKSMKINYVLGGNERQHSVKNGLKAVSSEVNYVLIHDTARPLLTQDMIDKGLAKVEKHKAVTLAVPSDDTMNVVENKEAIQTLDRSKIWNIQTPQFFEISLLKEAVENSEKNQLQVNEEGQLIQHFGHSVHVVLGSKKNMKLTTKDDLKIIEAILKSEKYGY